MSPTNAGVVGENEPETELFHKSETNNDSDSGAFHFHDKGNSEKHGIRGRFAQLNVPDQDNLNLTCSHSTQCLVKDGKGKSGQAQVGQLAGNLQFLSFCLGERGLRRVEEMPDHLKFNTYVHTGYRDLQSARECCFSMFYLHNETVNILTHLIPIFCVMYYWRSMFLWDDVKWNPYLTFLGWSHVTGSVTPWLGSVTYHLFMNHHKGPGFYKFLLQLDMLGIWITQAFGALTNMTASTWCLSDSSQQLWMSAYAIASAWGLHKAITADSALGRRMCFALCFASRLLGFLLRISPYGGGNPEVLTHVILQDVLSIIGGFIGVFRIPELWFPGKLDLFFNSHHIMHVMVVLAVYHMNWATNGDIRWILNNYSKSECITLF